MNALSLLHTPIEGIKSLISLVGLALSCISLFIIYVFIIPNNLLLYAVFPGNTFAIFLTQMGTSVAYIFTFAYASAVIGVVYKQLRENHPRPKAGDDEVDWFNEPEPERGAEIDLFG